MSHQSLVSLSYTKSSGISGSCVYMSLTQSCFNEELKNKKETNIMDKVLQSQSRHIIAICKFVSAGM